jgi:hypothetical protein
MEVKVLVALLLAATVGGCSRHLELELYNNTGLPIVLRLDKGLEGADRLVDESVRVQPGSRMRFRLGRMRDDQLHVVAGRCTVRYDVSEGYPRSPWRYQDGRGEWIVNSTVRVQLEPDLVLHLHAPVSALSRDEARRVRSRGGFQPVGVMRRAQRLGFPRAATSKVCS